MPTYNETTPEGANLWLSWRRRYSYPETPFDGLEFEVVVLPYWASIPTIAFISQYATLNGERVAIIRRRFRLFGNETSLGAGLKALKFPLAVSNRHFNACNEAVITVCDLPLYLYLAGIAQPDSNQTAKALRAVRRCLKYMNFFIPNISIQLGDPEVIQIYAKMYANLQTLRKLKPSYEELGFDEADHLQKVTAQRQRMGLWKS